MSNININKELEDFFESYDDSKVKRLKLLINNLTIESESYAGTKLSEFKPIYSTKKVIVHKPEISISDNSLF